jgi:hypothetical protein
MLVFNDEQSMPFDGVKLFEISGRQIICDPVLGESALSPIPHSLKAFEMAGCEH